MSHLHRFPVYATEQELRVFRNRAKSQGISLSRYVCSLAHAETAITAYGTAQRMQKIQQSVCQLVSCLSGLRQTVADDTSSELFNEAFALLVQIEKEACLNDWQNHSQPEF
jgi:hypothetical protein